MVILISKMNQKIADFVNILKKQGKLFYLCVVLFLIFVIHPFFDKTPFEELLLNIITTVILASAVYALGYNKKRLIWSICLGLPWLLSAWFDFFSPLDISLVSHSFGVLFYLYVIILLLRHIINANTITVDEIYGGIAIYLLIGMAFGVIYTVIYTVDSHSFNASFSDTNYRVGDWSDFLYFSYTTLTTLGYGDIIPLNTIAKSMVNLEAIIGVLYIAIMIARLIGIHTTNHKR